MIKVDARARLHADRAGEPLDGLVNMFDIGIILAVGFLIAALQALNQVQLLTKHHKEKTIHVSIEQKIEKIEPSEHRVPVKNTTPIGQVYENPEGKLVLVRNK